MRVPVEVSLVLLFLISCSESPEKESVTHTEEVPSVTPSVYREETITGKDSPKLHEGKWISYKMSFCFDSFPVKMYTGKLAEPDFSTVSCADEPGFREYINGRLENNGINFAGRYTIITPSLGAMASGMYMIDRKTGQILTDFSFNQDGRGRWGYYFKPNSSLVMANTSMMDSAMTVYSDIWGLTPEVYNWNGKKLKRLE